MGEGEKTAGSLPQFHPHSYGQQRHHVPSVMPANNILITDKCAYDYQPTCEDSFLSNKYNDEYQHL